MSKEDLAAANRMRAILDAGLAPEQLAELGRTIAVAMSQFAAASRQVVGDTFIGDGGAEDEVSDRVAEGAGGLIPTVGPTLDYVYRRHLREQLRHDAFDETDESRSRVGLPDAGLIAIGFADLVGFTKLGEQLPPEELGRVTGRLEEVAREVVDGPVRLVKLIGDAAMLASADTTSLLEATLELVERWPRRRMGFRWSGRGWPTGPRSPAGAITTAARSTWPAGSPRWRGRAACSSPPRFVSTSTRTPTDSRAPAASA